MTNGAFHAVMAGGARVSVYTPTTTGASVLWPKGMPVSAGLVKAARTPESVARGGMSPDRIAHERSPP